MKPPSVLAVSLMCNLALAVVFVAVRQMPAAPSPGTPAPPTSPPDLAAAPVARPPRAVPETRTQADPWHNIASADRRQYVANLRGAGCPEWLVRDMIVADIDAACEEADPPDPVYPAPWQADDPRLKSVRSESATRNEPRREKRALVKSVLGYEWENYAEEIWSQDLTTSLTLGFLPDEKAVQLLALKDEFGDAAQKVRQDANYILIDEDRARLHSLYSGFQARLSQLLDGPELDEFQLRRQQSFLIANDIHFDGVSLSHEELRALVRLSQACKDMALNEIVADRPPPQTEESSRMAAFESQVRNLLGAQRFADYERAQDLNFREMLAFSRQNNLPPSAAVTVYESRQNAAAQAAEIQNDGSLSPEERATALAVLKAAAANVVSSALGGSYQDYVQGHGQWLEALNPPPDAKETEAP